VESAKIGTGLLNYHATFACLMNVQSLCGKSAPVCDIISTMWRARHLSTARVTYSYCTLQICFQGSRKWHIFSVTLNF